MTPNQRRVVLLAVLLALAATPFVIYNFTRLQVTLHVDGRVQHLNTRADTVREVLDEAEIRLQAEDTVSPDLSTPLEDGMTITVQRAAVIALDVDGSASLIRTQLTHPLDILAQQQIDVNSFDMVRVDGQDFSTEQPWTQAPASILVRHSVTLMIVDGEQRLELHTTQTDVGSALDSAGLDLYLADGVTPGLSTPVKDGLIVEIERSIPVIVIADGQRIETRARGEVVGDALAQIGVAPVGLDYTIPPIDTPLTPGIEIRLIRVDGDTQPEIYRGPHE